MGNRWLELKLRGNKHAIVDGSSIQAVEGPDIDIMGTPENPITVYLRGGGKIEGVVAITVNSIMVWAAVNGGGLTVTWAENFWDELSRGGK